MPNRSDVQPGSIKIDRIVFTNFNYTESVDIQFLVEEFEIIEDMASPIVRARMVIHDTLSLFTRLPIVGLEQIDVQFTVDSANIEQYRHGTFTHTFVITAMKWLHSVTMRSEIFVLELASQQIIPARTRRVVKSFQATPIEDMVKSICEEILNIPNSQLQVEPTGINRDFVCPNLPPFETISILASEAKSGLIPSNYVFFADRNMWRFVTLETLKSGRRELPIPEIPTPGEGTFEGELSESSPGTIFQDSVIDEEYYFTEHNTPDDTTPTTPGVLNNGTIFMGGQKPAFMRKIVDYRIPTVFDIERGLALGLFDNSIVVIDPWSEIFKTHHFNYYKQFDDFLHTYENSAHRIIPENSPLKHNIGESHQRVIVTDVYTAMQDLQMNPRLRQDYIMHRISSVAALEQLTMHLVIPGDPDRKPGDTIKIEVPEFGATDDVLKEKNKYISGKYLVTSVKHKYNRNLGYYCHMACVKDCYESEITDTPGKFQHDFGASQPPIPGTSDIPAILGDPRRWQDMGTS